MRCGVQVMLDLTELVDKALNNPKIVTAVVAVVVFLIGYVIIPLRGSVVAFGSAVINYRKNRLHIRRVSSRESKDFDAFIGAYHEIFDEEERTSTTEIINWLKGKGSALGVEYYCFLCMNEGKPVAIAINMFSPELGLSYIPFLGMTEAGEKWRLGRPAIQQLFQATKKCYKNATFIILEMDDPSEPGTSGSERKRRVARIRRFQGLAAASGLEMVLVSIDYLQPSYHTDTADRVDKPMLLALLIAGRAPRHLSKEEVMSIIRFLYIDVYAACFNGTKEERDLYGEIVQNMIEDYEERLVSFVDIRPA